MYQGLWALFLAKFNPRYEGLAASCVDSAATNLNFSADLTFFSRNGPSLLSPLAYALAL